MITYIQVGILGVNIVLETPAVSVGQNKSIIFIEIENLIKLNII